MAFGLPELPALPNPLGALLGAAGTALLQRTYLLQTQTQDGIPRLLVVFDTINEETPDFEFDVTQHPVEKGPEVSDHIQEKNPTLKLKGKISNTPLDLATSIGNLVASGISFISSGQARANLLNTGLQQAAGIGGAALQGNAASLGGALAGAADALARTALLNAAQGKTPFDVVTKRQRYPSMVIQKLSFPRTNQTGYALEFEIEMIALRIVSPLQVQLTQLHESVISGASPATNLGSQTTRAVSDQATSSINGSWLRQIVKGVSG